VALELSAELGFLPLGLAQAAALIAREHLEYGAYPGRLRSVPVADYLGRVEGDAYPYRTAEAILLSLRGVEQADPSGRCIRLMGLVAVLAETGISRRLVDLAASGDDVSGMDAAAGVLADASLVGFSVDDAVAAHRLVMRVVRERLAADGRLAAVAAEAVQPLARLRGEITEAWRDPAGVRELADHISALTGCVQPHLNPPDAGLAAGLLQVRLGSVHLLNTLGDSRGQAVAVAGPLADDCAQTLGADHPGTLSAFTNLAYAYRLPAGRTAEAIPLLERTLAGRERVLGADHPDTLTSRNSLARAYRAAGRTAEAILLLERTLAGASGCWAPTTRRPVSYEIIWPNLLAVLPTGGLPEASWSIPVSPRGPLHDVR
jgi:hypothetical protein